MGLAVFAAIGCLAVGLPTGALATSSPVIESESVSGITEHDATLEAKIDTNDLYTGYWFQIDTNSSYNFTQAVCPWEFPWTAQCESILVGESLPPGLVEPHPEYIPAGSGKRSVSLDLASIGATLQPATTYHYRVIASNGPNGSGGPDQTFTTSGATSPKKVSPKHLTRTQKLSKALKACAKKPKRQRAACQKQAREKYTTTASKAKKRQRCPNSLASVRR